MSKVTVEHMENGIGIFTPNEPRAVATLANDAPQATIDRLAKIVTVAYNRGKADAIIESNNQLDALIQELKRQTGE